MAYSTISKPSLHFNTKLYTGTGSELALTGVGFQPDWTWIKNRDTTDSHQLVDAVRGATKNLFSNLSNAEATDAQGLKSFNTDGFTVGTRAGMNTSGEKYVGWNWKAGTAFTNDASSTGIGTIDSTGSFNNDNGFSIVSYTGTGSNGTIKHGLSSIPKMIITKKRSASQGWHVQHASLGATKELYLNTTDAAATGSTPWNNTTPTASVFSVGTSNGTNGSSATYIAYCFAEKQGFSKFGKYSANANADGNFIYTGMKPAFVLIKSSNAAQAGQDWFIYDGARDTGNTATQTLQPDTTTAEQTNVAPIDILSNGFKLRTSTGRINGTSGEYIYMAFAEEPLVANVGQSIPATAR